MCNCGTPFECPPHRREDGWPTGVAKNRFLGFIFSSGRESPPPGTVRPRCGALHARRVRRFRSDGERARPRVGGGHVATLNTDRKRIRPRRFASWLWARGRRQPRRWRVNHTSVIVTIRSGGYSLALRPPKTGHDDAAHPNRKRATFPRMPRVAKVVEFSHRPRSTHVARTVV